MTEAVKGTIEYCFKQLKLKKLWCGYFSDNPASGRVQEKCGFKYQYKRNTHIDVLNKDVEIITGSIENPDYSKVLDIPLRDR